MQQKQPRVSDAHLAAIKKEKPGFNKNRGEASALALALLLYCILRSK